MSAGVRKRPGRVTVGDVRAAIAGVADDVPVGIAWGEVPNDAEPGVSLDAVIATARGPRILVSLVYLDEDGEYWLDGDADTS